MDRTIFKVPAFLIAVSILTAVPAFGRQDKQAIAMQVLFKPGVVVINGEPTVYYELFLTSHSSDSIHLQGLAIYKNKGLVRSIESDELKKRGSLSILPPGATSILYLELALPDHTPGRLTHQLVFETKHNHTAQSQSVEGGVTGFSNQIPLVVGAPLKEGAWAAVYDPSWTRGHRRVIYTVNKKDRIPGRFAIDFIKLDSQGRYAAGDDNAIKNWYGYGVDVLAVADGTIASTRDDFTESETLSGHPAYTSDKATGNFISIDIGNGHIVFYEHLKPGSIKVKAGQLIKKGDVIASLGFTGQTTGPHLHFHIANANSPLGAEGISFAFERFTIIGTYPDFGTFGKGPWSPAGNATITKERPAPNTVIRFQP